jgi:hypothetical protein
MTVLAEILIKQKKAKPNLELHGKNNSPNVLRAL